MAGPREKLINTMRILGSQKGLEKITVGEILQASNVSRQTFYKLFQDKYALAFAVFQQDIGTPIITHFDDTKSFDSMNRTNLLYLKEHAAFYQSIFRDNSSQNVFLQMYHTYCVDQVINIIGRMNISKDTEVLINMWFTGIKYLLSKWFSTGTREDVEILVDLFRRSVPIELHPFLFKDIT